METMKRIIAITITCNRIETTKKYLKELKEKAGYPYRHIIVDNGSKDGTVEWLKSEGYEVIELPENKGIAYALMEAYKKAIATEKKIDYIVKYDDDCLIHTNDIVKKLVEAMGQIGDGMILSPLDIGILPNYQPTTFGYLEINNYKIRVTTHTGGIFQLIPKRAMDILYKEAQISLDQIRKDVVRGGLWRRHGMFCGYLPALKVEHKGRGTSTKKYIF